MVPKYLSEVRSVRIRLSHKVVEVLVWLHSTICVHGEPQAEEQTSFRVDFDGSRTELEKRSKAVSGSKESEAAACKEVHGEVCQLPGIQRLEGINFPVCEVIVLKIKESLTSMY